MFNFCLTFQVWLCDDASFSQQNKCHEAVGTALDQKLPVWWSVEEDPPDTHLIPRHTGGAQVFCCNDVAPVNKLMFDFTL